MVYHHLSHLNIIKYHLNIIKYQLNSNLVGFQHFLFSISYMGCYPKPIDELHHFSRWAHCTTNQQLLGYSPFEDLLKDIQCYTEFAGLCVVMGITGYP